MRLLSQYLLPLMMRRLYLTRMVYVMASLRKETRLFGHALGEKNPQWRAVCRILWGNSWKRIILWLRGSKWGSSMWNPFCLLILIWLHTRHFGRSSFRPEGCFLMSFGMITTVTSLPCSPMITIHIFQHQHFQLMSSISSPSTRSLTKIAAGIATQFDGLNYICTPEATWQFNSSVAEQANA